MTELDTPKAIFITLARSAGIRATMDAKTHVKGKGNTVLEIVRRIEKDELEFPDSEYKRTIYNMLHVWGTADRSVLQLECEAIIGMAIRNQGK